MVNNKEIMTFEEFKKEAENTFKDFLESKGIKINE